MEDAILQILNSIDSELWGILIKGFIAVAGFQILSNLAKSLAIYLRVRFSTIFSKRTVIIYNGFEGVIEEISMSGIFIRDKDGVTMFVPLNRWYMGEIKYPNAFEHEKSDKLPE